MPIHEANGDKNAGYDPSFFFAVESTYGTLDQLRMLVDEAHGMGLAAIFDSVINHLTNDAKRSSFSQAFISGYYTRKDAPWSNDKQWGGSDWGPDPDSDRQEIRNLWIDHHGTSTTDRLGSADNEYTRMKMRLAWSMCARSLGTPMMFMGTECMNDEGWHNYEGYGNMEWSPAPGCCRASTFPSGA